MNDEDEWAELHSFAELYGCGLDVEDEAVDGLPLTRRMAYYLWSAALMLHDVWRQVARDTEGGSVRDLYIGELPFIAQRFASAEWLDRFAYCFKDIAERLAAGRFSDTGVTNCTGDEVAVWLTIALARDLVSDGELALPADFDDRLPPCGEGDEDFDLVSDVLAADDDVTRLWDPASDGIEDEDSPETRFVNLHPRRWFLPFN